MKCQNCRGSVEMKPVFGWGTLYECPVCKERFMAVKWKGTLKTEGFRRITFDPKEEQ